MEKTIKWKHLKMIVYWKRFGLKIKPFTYCCAINILILILFRPLMYGKRDSPLFQSRATRWICHYWVCYHLPMVVPKLSWQNHYSFNSCLWLSSDLNRILAKLITPFKPTFHFYILTMYWVSPCNICICSIMYRSVPTWKIMDLIRIMQWSLLLFLLGSLFSRY